MKGMWWLNGGDVVTQFRGLCGSIVAHQTVNLEARKSKNAQRIKISASAHLFGH